jgi:hypothetical protein
MTQTMRPEHTGDRIRCAMGAKGLDSRFVDHSFVLPRACLRMTACLHYYPVGAAHDRK